jgi:hypothetical protein
VLVRRPGFVGTVAVVQRQMAIGNLEGEQRERSHHEPAARPDVGIADEGQINQVKD